MPKITAQFSAEKAERHAEMIQAVLGNMPYLENVDRLTVNYTLDAGGFSEQMLLNLRRMLEVVRDEGVDVEISGLDEANILRMAESSRLLLDIL